MRRKWLFMGPAAVVGILVFGALGGTIVRQLWNWLLPSFFGWPQVTFWQALGMLALCRILFGGLGHRGPCRAYRTDEERERARQRIRERFGFGRSPGEEVTPPRP
jgi:uncharacterized membrane protein